MSLLKSISWLDFTYQIIAPCGVNDFVCGQATEWVSNGTELCHAAGFAVKLYDDAYVDVEEVSCYGGRASLDSISDSWRSPDSPLSEFTQKAENIGVVEDFQQWVQEMQFIEKVSWAVGGLVLTAGLLFMRLDQYILAFLRLPDSKHSLLVFIFQSSL